MLEHDENDTLRKNEWDASWMFMYFAGAKPVDITRVTQNRMDSSTRTLARICFRVKYSTDLNRILGALCP